MEAKDIVNSICFEITQRTCQTGQRPKMIFISSAAHSIISREFFGFGYEAHQALRNDKDMVSLFGIPCKVYLSNEVEYYIGEKGILFKEG